MAGVLAKAVAGTTAGMMTMAAVLAAVPVNAAADEVVMEWREENGVKYWYENGVRQGVKYNADGSIDISYRGKEIYDPSSAAWYWLDCVQNGAVAKNKDVYQESAAGQWGAGTNENGEKVGKWVRYDENGHMVKGWQTTEAGTYYFDPVYGTMAKGDVVIDGQSYYFNKDTGILERSGQTDDDGNSFLTDGWHKVGGINYWYENGVRQGVKYNADGSIDTSYRGKEIYDPSSAAWYWLDCVQNGAVAKNKDVYQESAAGQWGAGTNENGEKVGKWVRYDENGHMVKGWQTTEAGTYYFDTVYGTMAKGLADIDGSRYYFKVTTGAAEKDTVMDLDGHSYVFDAEGRGSILKSLTYMNRYANGDIKAWYESTYDENGNELRYTEYNEDGTISWYDEMEYDANNNQLSMKTYYKEGVVSKAKYYEYDANNNMVKSILCDSNNEVTGTNWMSYDDRNNLISVIHCDGDSATAVSWREEYEYDDNGNKIKMSYYYGHAEKPGWWDIYEYDANNTLRKESRYKYSGLIQSTEYDERGNKTGDNIKNIYYDETNTREALFYRDGEVSSIELYRYNDNGDEILCQYLTGDRQKITFWRAMEYNEYNYPVKKTYYNGNVDNIKYYIDYIYR